MEGLELRKAALGAAFIRVEPITVFHLTPPARFRLTFMGDAFPDSLDTWDTSRYYSTETEAWQHAPAVESSVDAALQWLTLDDGCGWVINQAPYLTGEADSWYVQLQDYRKILRYGITGESLSVAMCEAYLNYKKDGAK